MNSKPIVHWANMSGLGGPLCGAAIRGVSKRYYLTTRRAELTCAECLKILEKAWRKKT